jgi:hypothetical protein
MKRGRASRGTTYRLLSYFLFCRFATLILNRKVYRHLWAFVKRAISGKSPLPEQIASPRSTWRGRRIANRLSQKYMERAIPQTRFFHSVAAVFDRRRVEKSIFGEKTPNFLKTRFFHSAAAFFNSRRVEKSGFGKKRPYRSSDPFHQAQTQE